MLPQERKAPCALSGFPKYSAIVNKSIENHKRIFLAVIATGEGLTCEKNAWCIPY